MGKFFVYSAKTGMERMHRRLNVVKYLGWTEDTLLKKKVEWHHNTLGYYGHNELFANVCFEVQLNKQAKHKIQRRNSTSQVIQHYPVT